MTDRLFVYFENQYIGQLWLENRAFCFQYRDAWLSDPSAVPLSVRLPLKKEAFSEDVVRPFFANLLPEGGVRTLVARKLGISERNDFELLAALGGECAGAISVWPNENHVSETNKEAIPLSEDELKNLIAGMGDNPLLTMRGELRLSLAGAQQKIPVLVNDGKIFLPGNGAPSSHILKPQSPSFPYLAENEYFCMTLARRLGWDVPEIMLRGGEFPYVLVERYDRKKDPQGQLQRLHQEDFCQALGFQDSQKYESEGGPGLAACFKLVSEQSTQPAVDKQRLLQWIFFNVFIGNCDAHAKNISMLISRQAYKLSPFYDLVSTKAYPHLSAKLAMKVGGQARPEWILPHHLERLAQQAELGIRAVISIGQEVQERLPSMARTLLKEFHFNENAQPLFKRLLQQIDTIASKMRFS